MKGGSFLIGSSWVGNSGAAVIIPPPDIPPPNPPPDGGTDPDPEDPPPIDEEVTDWSDWADALSPVAKFKVVNGALIDAMGGQGGSFFGTGMLQPQQPSMLVGDEAPYSFGLDGNVWGEIPSRADMNLPAMSVIVVFQRRTLSTYPWMSLVSRDDLIGSVSQEGGWALSVTNAGAPRWSVRPAGLTATVIAGAADSVPAGEIVMLVATTGPSGMKLFLNGVSVATDAAIIGASPITSVTQIGTYRSGGSNFNGAIQEVIIVPSQLDETAAATGYAFVKSEVRWANDGAITLQASTTGVFDPRPKALVGSTTPTAVVTVQPSNATATAQADGTISVTAGGSAGSSTNGRFTLDGSPPAVLSVTVTAIPTPPASSLHLTPFKAASAIHLPIGASATFQSASDPATADMLNIAGITIPNRDASSASYPWGGAFVVEAISSDATYTVSVAPGETPFGTMPVTLKLPESMKTLTETVGDRTACVTSPDGVTQHNFYHFRWDGTKFVAGGCRIYRLDGLGHGEIEGDRVGTSASGMAQFGTYYRPEWYHDKSLAVPSMIHLVLPRCSTYDKGLSAGLVAPATARDSGYATINSGNIPYGAVFSFVHGFNINSIGLSADGLRTLAQPIYDYGLVAVDGRGCTSYAALRCTSGSASHQNLPSAAAATLQGDMEKIRPHLRLITNGAWFEGQTVRGGGTPRAPNRAVV